MNTSSLLRKRNIIFLLIVILIVGIAAFTINYINSQQIIQVRYENISKVTIQKIGQGARSLEKEVIFKKSGEKIKVSKGHYLLKYRGSGGYGSDYQSINIENKPISISLDPDYSEQKLASLLEADFEAIKSVLNNRFQNMSDYAIQKGKLYKKGEWYATTLQYIGNDYFNYDSLRLVMKKENGSWKLVTNPPDIIISKQAYPDIPIDILRDLNNNQNANFSEKYTDPNSKVYFP